MPYSSVTACLTIADEHRDIIVEEVADLIDSFVLRGIAVYDTDLKCVAASDVKDARALQREMRPGKKPKSQPRVKKNQ